MIDQAKAVAQRLRDRIHDSHMTVEIMCDEAADVIDALVAEVERLKYEASMQSNNGAELLALRAENAKLREATQALCDRIYDEGCTPLDWREYDAARAALEVNHG